MQSDHAQYTVGWPMSNSHLDIPKIDNRQFQIWKMDKSILRYPVALIANSKCLLRQQQSALLRQQQSAYCYGSVLLVKG